MLQLGSKGAEVKTLQEKLIARGYSVGSYGADGDFGQGTHDAVMRFQRDKGLAVDGIVGPDTMRAIDGSIGTTILRKGDKGPAVRELQTKLISKGYSVGSYGADGDFGQGTHDAVMKFQRDNRLDADGVVGPATWSILNGFSNGSLLKKGDKGAEVKKLQEKLIARGYSVGSYGADGDFGQGTHDAVMKFQRDNKLAVDGIVGPATWEILNGVNGNLVLRKGDKGAEVKSLQEKLITRGYSVGAYGADGDFGQGTHDAVMRFQRDNGLDADGVAGPKTFYALNANPSGTLLRLGSKGEEVRNLQERLIARGYSVGSYGADGDFGQGTHDAVVKFQRDNGLDADGVVGRATWAALGTNDTLLRLGSKGAEVKRLQEKLISKGYSVGSAGADGDFGQGTHDAVIKFQKDNSLSVDGVVGPATWSALNGFGDWNPGIGGAAGVKKMLNAAKSQLGVKETPVNITSYGVWYGMNGVAWCAIFVSWCANQGEILGNVVPKFHWCATGVNWYKSRGRYMVRSAGTPQSGDVIFFYTSKDAFYHVGIVDYVSNGTVYTIEGNTDDAVRKRSYPINDYRIHGYGKNGGLIDVDTSENDEVIYRATGRVNAGTTFVNIRKGSNTGTSILGTLTGGAPLTISKKIKPKGDTYTWYKIEFEKQLGYIREDFVSIEHNYIKQERVVIVGAEGTARYPNFFECAVKKLRELKDKYPKDKRTLYVATIGLGVTERSLIVDLQREYNYECIFYTDRTTLYKHLNASKFKISKMFFYAHGKPGAILLGYGAGTGNLIISNPNFDIYKNQIGDINFNIFANDSITEFYSCFTASLNEDFSKVWYNLKLSKTKASEKKTNYGFTAGKTDAEIAEHLKYKESGLPFNPKGALYYPELSSAGGPNKWVYYPA